MDWIGLELAEKESLGITTNMFTHNCTPPECYWCILAHKEYQAPTIICTHSVNIENRHRDFTVIDFQWLFTLLKLAPQ